MNIVYKHREIPRVLAHSVGFELDKRDFREMWNPSEIARPFTSLVPFTMPGRDLALLGMSVVRMTPSQSISTTKFPPHYGNLVALVVLGSSIQITMEAMGTTLRVHDRSILILEHVRNTQHSLVAQGACYIVLMFEPEDS